MRDGDRVNVDIDHLGTRAALLRDLVHVPLGRDAGPDIQELADAGLREEPHCPAEKVAVGPGDGPDAGVGRGQRPADVLVGQEIVAAAQQVVINPGAVRPLDVDLRRNPAWLATHHASGPHVRGSPGA